MPTTAGSSSRRRTSTATRPILLRIPNLKKIDRAELRDLVAEAWLTRAQKRVAKAWLAEHGEQDD